MPELFRCIIPYTVNLNGNKVDLTKQIKDYVNTERIQEMSKARVIAIEDEIFFNDEISKKELYSIDPRHILAGGYFGECKENGVEFIVTHCDPSVKISIPSIRFGCVIASVSLDNHKDIQSIAFTHILAKRIISNDKKDDKNDCRY